MSSIKLPRSLFLTLGGIIFTWLLWLAIGGHLWLFLRANNRLSVIAHDPINDDYGIYLYNIDDLQRITPLGIRPTYHKWAPDGKNIAFMTPLQEPCIKKHIF